MKRFSDFYRVETLLEGKSGYPLFLKTTVMILVLRIRSLENKIKDEKNEHERDKILAQISAYSAYLSALAIAIDTEDRTTVGRISALAKKL